MSEHRVVFTPSGLQGTVPKGTTVLEAARELGVDLDTVCGGRGICGRCQVEPSVGSFAKWAIDVEADHLSPWGPLEANYKGKRAIVEGLCRRRAGVTGGLTAYDITALRFAVAVILVLPFACSSWPRPSCS